MDGAPLDDLDGMPLDGAALRNAARSAKVEELDGKPIDVDLDGEPIKDSADKTGAPFWVATRKFVLCTVQRIGI